jgi:hypothetical protein
MSNHVDRLYAAVTVVASHGDIKQRLIRAFEEHLAIIEDDELPVAVRPDFVALRNLMSGVEPLNGEGRIRATVRKLSMPEADNCARKMLDIYTDLVKLSDELQDIVPLVKEDQQLVPPFLVKSANS